MEVIHLLKNENNFLVRCFSYSWYSLYVNLKISCTYLYSENKKVIELYYSNYRNPWGI